MQALSVRLSDRTFEQLDALAGEHGITRTRLVRRLLQAGLRSVHVTPAEAPTEQGLLELLAEKARMGHVGAINALLAREQAKDPRAAALAALEQIAAERGS
jgi:predicted transcriptional regulator